MVGVAVNVTFVFEHIDVAVDAIETAGITDELTVIEIGDDVAVTGEAQVAVDVITHVTISPLDNVELVYDPPVATFVPLTFH